MPPEAKRFQISRRSFVKACSAAAAASGLPMWFIERVLAQDSASAKRPSPNDRPGIALIGCGGQGRGDANNARRFGDILAVCDVDDTHADAAAKQFTAEGKTPDSFNDFRKLLERRDIHVIVNATPDHWHTLINLAASRAGKDIYGEKPLTLTIDEGKHVVETVRKQKTVFQTGSQQRSDRRFRLACELVRNGRIGKLKQITVWLPAGPREGPFLSSAAPAGLNWDYWLGQAPKLDYVRQRCHSTFRYWYDYSGGTMTDWGAHHNDIALWAVGLPGPVAVEGKPLAQPIPGGYTAFSEYEVNLTYANGVVHTIRTTTDDSLSGAVVRQDGQRNGLKFEGTDGWIWVNRGEITASDDDLLTKPLPDSAQHLYVSSDHMGNFFECIRSRKAPICEAEVGHRAATVCHLGNIALRTGQKLTWDPAAERFKGERHKEANTYLSRTMRKPYDYTFGA
jgi:predicted dehydrogenase